MSSTTPTPTSTRCNCCTHESSHYLIRCGCPNDRPPTHPMHIMDDAFHRQWCATCLLFCVQPPTCSMRYDPHAHANQNLLSYLSSALSYVADIALSLRRRVFLK
ncbi:hypothetical protein BDZ89DRAFT_1062520 [Hymenopellis radicata]|nr:hypothetical protein BDZ89DRAFT_1062520 [Hymenopellis radicata]